MAGSSGSFARIEIPEQDVDLIAEESRAAALAFVNGVRAGWTKRDLADWLRGPYRDATRYTDRAPRFTARRRPDGTLDERIADLLEHVRVFTLAALGDVAGGKVDFVAESIRRRCILPAKGPDGSMIWVPIDGRFRLKMRVFSLLAVDYIARPNDYLAELFICPLCETLGFDEDAKVRGACGRHPRTSGIITTGGAKSEVPVPRSGARRVG